MKTPSRSSDPQKYKPFKLVKRPVNYTALADEWVIVVGADFSTSSDSTFTANTHDVQIQIIDGVSLVSVDSFMVGAFSNGTIPPSISPVFVGLPRRMIMYPGDQVISNGNGVSLVSCRSLEDALAIL